MNGLYIGFEWSRWKFTELVFQYTKTLERGYVDSVGAIPTTNADRIGLQPQINY